MTRIAYTHAEFDAMRQRAETAEARIAQLEAALRRIAGQHCALVAGSCKSPYLCVTCIARAALAPAEPEKDRGGEHG